MTYEQMEENLKRLRQTGKENVGQELPADYKSHKKHPYVPKHTGKIWTKREPKCQKKE